jgi:hypothetical protein
MVRGKDGNAVDLERDGIVLAQIDEACGDAIDRGHEAGQHRSVGGVGQQGLLDTEPLRQGAQYLLRSDG